MRRYSVVEAAEWLDVKLPALPDRILEIPVFQDLRPCMKNQAAYRRNWCEGYHADIRLGEIPAWALQEAFLHEVAHAVQFDPKLYEPPTARTPDAWVREHTGQDFIDAYRYMGASRYYLHPKQNELIIADCIEHLYPWFPEPPPWVLL